MSEMSIMQTIIMSKIFDSGVRFSSIIPVYFVLTILLWINTFLVMPKSRILFHEQIDDKKAEPETEGSYQIVQGIA